MTSKLLLLSDTHKSPQVRGTIERALEVFGADLIVHAGDFSVFGSNHEALFISARDCSLPIVFTSGNHETVEFCQALEREFGGSYIDYKSIALKGIRFTGIAGYDLSSPNRNSTLRQFSRRLSDSAHDGFSVLLTHKPPLPWAKDGVEFGSATIADIIQTHSFHLVITGHIHETRPRIEQSSKGTPIINPGAAGVLVEVDTATGSFKMGPELDRG